MNVNCHPYDQHWAVSCLLLLCCYCTVGNSISSAKRPRNEDRGPNLPVYQTSWDRASKKFSLPRWRIIQGCLAHYTYWPTQIFIQMCAWANLGQAEPVSNTWETSGQWKFDESLYSAWSINDWVPRILLMHSVNSTVFTFPLLNKVEASWQQMWSFGWICRFILSIFFFFLSFFCSTIN